jgi:hypothetical protein
LVQLYCGELTPDEALAAATRGETTARERRGETADSELRRLARREHQCDCSEASAAPEYDKGPAVAG